jgi:hypothetical protein
MPSGNTSVLFLRRATMGRNSEAITLSLNPDEKAELEALAQQFGILWGSQPNISGLVRAIARKRIMLYQPGTPITGGDRDYYRGQLASLRATVANLEELAP